MGKYRLYDMWKLVHRSIIMTSKSYSSIDIETPGYEFASESGNDDFVNLNSERFLRY